MGLAPALINAVVALMCTNYTQDICHLRNGLMNNNNDNNNNNKKNNNNRCFQDKACPMLNKEPT